MITQGDRLIGTISVSGRGTGYFTPEGAAREDALIIEQEHLATALNKDEVEVLVVDESTAKVERIITRSRMQFVCTVKKDGTSGVACFADDTHMYHPFNVDPKEAREGNKYLIEITSWNNVMTRPDVSILEEIGRAGENETEMRAIVLEAGFHPGFPHDVDAAAEKLPRDIPDEEIKKRRDIRGIPTFTIDPDDSKDFDDALSLQKLDDGTYEVGVHIADVSYYVTPGSVIDIEAQKRATSIYLVDRTIPMLPERLSNDLCSLVPNQDRLSYSVIVKMNKEAEVLDTWIGRTVMHSNRRFTYQGAQEIIDVGSGEHYEELSILNDLAKKMTARGINAGAISFHTTEVKFKLAEDGTPIDIYPYEIRDTNKMIEQYALLANRTVAEYVDTHSKDEEKKTFIYRVHDVPSMERIGSAQEMLAGFGHKLQLGKESISSKEINRIIDEVQNTPEANLVQMSLLRSMSKAIYSTQNIGHFGLAISHYTHFTSPIRRYPDVLVHRLITDYLLNGKSPDPAWYIKMASHSTEMEIRATGAERASVRYKQAEFMGNHIGSIFDAVVTGTSKFGLFAETVGTKTEGMIRMRNIGRDYYEYDPKDDVVRGRDRKKVFKLGDQIKIKVLGADTERKQIDFARVEER
ncbi:MAG: ribonuclease R [bacterium]|nr:ribonuclease R [bacterium]